MGNKSSKCENHDFPEWKCKVYNVSWNKNDSDLNGMWIKPNGERGGVYKICFNELTGQEYMRKALGFNSFGNCVPVPKNYKVSRLLKHQKSFVRKRNEKPDLDGLEVSDWIANLKTKDCLKIRDISSLKTGQKIKLLVLDRNVIDITNTSTNNKPSTLFKPTYFFNHNYAVYTQDKGLKGFMKWSYNKKKKPFEFEIEYQNGSWFPLHNGYLPKKDPQDFAEFSYDKPKHWSEFPDDTCIGWRGPMVKWRYINNKQKVFWYEK